MPFGVDNHLQAVYYVFKVLGVQGTPTRRKPDGQTIVNAGG